MLDDFGQSRLVNPDWQITIAVEFGPLFHGAGVIPPSSNQTRRPSRFNRSANSRATGLLFALWLR